MKDDATESRFIPYILLLVSLEVSFLASLVLLSLVPHIFLRHFIHQSAIVILHGKIPLIRIFCQYAGKKFINDHLAFHTFCLCNRVYIGIGRSFFHASLVQKLQNALAMKLVRLELVAVCEIYDMVSHSRLERFRHLPSLQLICSSFKIRNHHALAKLPQGTTSLCAALVIAVGLSHLSEALSKFVCWHVFQNIVDRVYTIASGRYLFGCSILTQQHQDVACDEQILSAKASSCIVIRASSFPFYIRGVYYGRNDELFLVSIQFLPDSRNSVQSLSHSFSHLQFEVDEQWHILLHGLLV